MDDLKLNFDLSNKGPLGGYTYFNKTISIYLGKFVDSAIKKNTSSEKLRNIVTVVFTHEFGHAVQHALWGPKFKETLEHIKCLEDEICKIYFSDEAKCQELLQEIHLLSKVFEDFADDFAESVLDPNDSSLMDAFHKITSKSLSDNPEYLLNDLLKRRGILKKVV